MWNNLTKMQSEEPIRDTRSLKKHPEKLETLIEGLGLTTNATFVDEIIRRNNHTISKVKDISVDTNAIVSIGKVFSLLKNIIIGKVVSQKKPSVVEAVKNTKYGNEWYSSVMGINVFGVKGVKGWKLTTLKDGVHTQNFVMKLPTEELSV